MNRVITLCVAAGLLFTLAGSAEGQPRKMPSKPPPPKQAASQVYRYHVYQHPAPPHRWPPQTPYRSYYRYPVSIPYYVPRYVPYQAGYVVVPNFYQPSVTSTLPMPVPSTVSLPPASTNQAVICVVLPDPAAKVWFNGVQTTTNTTATRVYNTPSLTPGFDYEYRIRARWIDRGHVVTREKDVHIQAGGTFVVDFTL